MDSHRQSPHSPFRSRRSHPALNHISLAPLTPRFPIDDLPEPNDYFQSSHGQSTSYLSSSSVPNTPPILSHSRASSRTRHHKRTKSSSYAVSDTDLQSLPDRSSLQRPRQHIKDLKSSSHTPISVPSVVKRKSHDSEWLLRAGLALTSSTREEKGQSWLVKRESSTSLVAEAEPDTIRTRTTSSRRSRGTPHLSARSSAVSTPAVLSRRGSSSREHSRRTSRADFAMTAMGDAERNSSAWHSRKSSAGSHHVVLPDFVDEQIRAEMASIHGRDLYGRNEDDGASDSSYYDSENETDDGMDEKEFQRLTRQQGFGLGSWVDQFVSWTLFGVEDDTSTLPPAAVEDTKDEKPLVAFEPIAPTSEETSNEAAEDDHEDLDSMGYESAGLIEKAGDQGGWADARWFFRLAKQTLI